MNKLTTDKRVSVVKHLVDGCSINGTVRMTGVSKNTILKLLSITAIPCGTALHQPPTVLAIRPYARST